jgi:hypothetical protein
MRIKLSSIALLALALCISSGCSNTSPSSTHSVTFTVTATSGVTLAESINYTDTSSTVTSLTDVPLPWTLTVSMPVTSTQNTVDLWAQAKAADSSSTLTGTIADDGVTVKEQTASASGIYISIALHTLI